MSDVEGFVQDGAKQLEQHVQEHPQPLFTLLRDLRPVLLIHDIAIVTRYDDVVEVLSNDAAFSVEPYAGKMQALAGEFILGLDDSAQYERAVSILRLAAPRADLPRLAGFVEQTAQELATSSPGGGRLDVVQFAERVPARLIGRWFGTPGPDEDSMIAWTKAMFEDIFVNLKDDPAIHAAAMDASVKLRAYLAGLIASRKGGAAGDDVLGRLIAMQSTPGTALSDEEIATNLIGLLVGFIPTVSTASSFAIDALLDRPDALRSAQKAALADDDRAVQAHMWEAMRLAPQGPGLIRRARSDFVVGEGSHHATTVAAGTPVFAATESAMLDGRVIEDPDGFRVGRPAHHYLHFGVGMHACFGRFANAMQIPQIGKAVLRLPDLARAEGDEGRLVKDGPYASSLVVSYSH